jgi:hypothetical protein
MPLSDTECLHVAAAVSSHARLKDHHTAAHLDNAKRMLVAVRVDTDHIPRPGKADIERSVSRQPSVLDLKQRSRRTSGSVIGAN